jgi:hypothetical protein
MVDSEPWDVSLTAWRTPDSGSTAMNDGFSRSLPTTVSLLASGLIDPLELQNLKARTAGSLPLA